MNQHKDVELSLDGIKQAKIVARRFENVPIDIILASPYARTVQTAEIINSAIKKEIRYSPLLTEMKIPSEFIGKSQEDTEVMKIRKLRRDHANDPLWHYSDEENFSDVKARAIQCIDYFATIHKDAVLVVTHGTYIKIIIFTMMLGEMFTPEFWYVRSNFFHTDNTGITVCERKEDGEYKLLTWNDSAHLGELL